MRSSTPSVRLVGTCPDPPRFPPARPLPRAGGRRRLGDRLAHRRTGAACRPPRDVLRRVLRTVRDRRTGRREDHALVPRVPDQRPSRGHDGALLPPGRRRRRRHRPTPWSAPSSCGSLCNPCRAASAGVRRRAPRESGTSMRALLVGWFSFEGMGATAGDLLAARRRTVVADGRRGGRRSRVGAALLGGGGLATGRPEAVDAVVFVCGPFGNGPPLHELLHHFRACRLIGLDVTMLEPLQTWNPFDLLIERDSSDAREPRPGAGRRRRGRTGRGHGPHARAAGVRRARPPP